MSGLHIFLNAHQKMLLSGKCIDIHVTFLSFSNLHIFELTNVCRATRSLRVKLSGDGTTVGKRIHCVIFSFTILDEVQTTSSVDGIHPVAIF